MESWKCENPECENIVTEKTKRKTRYRKYCSVVCRNISRTEKIKATCNILYGTTNVMTLECKKNKMKQTMIERHGVDNPSKSSIIQENKKNNYFKNHGVSHHMYLDEIKEKIKHTNVLKYGVTCTLHNSDVSEKTQTTNIMKYGNKTYISSDIARNTIHNINLLKYGRVNPINVHIPIETLIMLDDINWLQEQIEDKSIIQIAQELNISPRTIHIRLEKYNIPVKHHAKSFFEKQIYEYVHSINPSAIQNDRTQIKPFELDVYLPDLNLAFECNGEYWHKEPQKEINKFNMCKEKGIELHFVWYKDWKKDKEAIYQHITNLIKSDKYS